MTELCGRREPAIAIQNPCRPARSHTVDGGIGHTRKLRRLAWLAATLLVGLNVGLSIYGVAAYWWRVPWLDMVRVFEDYFRLSFWQFLIKPENEHVHITANLLYALDFNFFHASGGLLIISMWALIAASAWAIASAARCGTPEMRQQLFWGFFGLSLVFFLWLANWENLLWPHQVILYSSLVLFLLSARLYSRWGANPPRIPQAVAAIGLMCLSIFSFGSGVAGAVAMLVVLLLQRVTRRIIVVTAVCLGASIAICLSLVHTFGTTSPVDAPLKSLTQIPAIAGYVIVLFSAPIRLMLAPVTDTATARFVSEFASFLGLFAAGAILVSAWRQPKSSAATGFALSLVTFGLASSMMTAMARLPVFGVEQALASRYIIISSLFWIGLTMYRAAGPEFRWQRPVMLGIALSVLSLVAIWQVRWLSLQGGAPMGETEMALLNGVDIPSILAKVWPPAVWPKVDAALCSRNCAGATGRSSTSRSHT